MSIADNYWQDEPFEKKYDLVLFGRQKPLLVEYIDRYEKDIQVLDWLGANTKMGILFITCHQQERLLVFVIRERNV